MLCFGMVPPWDHFVEVRANHFGMPMLDRCIISGAGLATYLKEPLEEPLAFNSAYTPDEVEFIQQQLAIPPQDYTYLCLVHDLKA